MNIVKEESPKLRRSDDGKEDFFTERSGDSLEHCSWGGTENCLYGKVGE
jgi:hypothetical protein